MIIKSLALAGAGLLVLVTAIPASAQTDYSGLCVAVGVEIGLRADSAQEELDSAVDVAGEDVSATEAAEIDSWQELLDNLQTISASMDVLYDAEATPPSAPEMEVVSEENIEALIDAAKECIDAA
ncbi:hypothetical protein [Asticcacaulis sp. AC402]|uniref:hypothetical protein n=1 Tax=Asticcacaulis sp. AC402 TaxID=1282361 RepID=UPI000424A478|nr:hypothetical protein [Asticcacaulis sp. AC402]